MRAICKSCSGQPQQHLYTPLVFVTRTFFNQRRPRLVATRTQPTVSLPQQLFVRVVYERRASSSAHTTA